MTDVELARGVEHGVALRMVIDVPEVSLGVFEIYWKIPSNILRLGAFIENSKIPPGLPHIDHLMREVHADDHIVRSISYNSPLEVILWLGSAGGGLAIARQALATWDRYQQSRLITSQVDAAVAANRAIRDQIESVSAVAVDDLITPQSSALIEGYARSIVGIQSIEIEQD